MEAKVISVERARPLRPQTKKKNTAIGASSTAPRNAHGGAVPVSAFSAPFPSLLRMPSVKEMYSVVLTGTTGKPPDSSCTGEGRLPSGDNNAIAAMFLRQLRVACAAHTGKTSGDSGVSSSRGSSDVLCSHAGFTFYRHLYDMHRWLFSSGACEHGRRVVVKHAWQALFAKKLRPWRVFMTILGSEMMLADENAASGFLTMLYNILQITSRPRRKRVIRLCCRFRLPQECISILEGCEDAFAAAVRLYNCGNSTRSCNLTLPREGGSQELNARLLGSDSFHSPPFALMRVVEAAAMLLGLCGSGNAKVLRVVRRTNALSSLLYVTELLFATVARQLSQIKTNDRKYFVGDDEGGTEAVYCRNEAHLYCASISQHVLPTCDALLHLVVALYQLAALPANADFMGERGVKLCVQLGWMLHSFLSKEMSLLRALSLPLQDHLERVALRSIELLSRLCCGTKTRKKSLEAAREQGAVGMLVNFSTHPSRRAEVGLASLDALNALTTKDSGCREQLHGDAEEISTLVQGVVRAAELAARSADHWHKLYVSLYALFGVVTLPGEVDATRRNEGAAPTLRVVPSQHSFSVLTPDVMQGFSLLRVGGTTMPLSLLSIDFQPDAFSPELHKEGEWGFATDTLAFIAPEKLPWLFSNDVLPPSREIAAPLFPDVGMTEVELGRCLLSHTLEALQPTSSEVKVRVLKRLIERLCTPFHCIDRVVYERPPLVVLPSLQVVLEEVTTPEQVQLLGGEESRGGGGQAHFEAPSLTGFLKFQSDFESGNLQRAVAIDEVEYDLVLSPDTNTNCHVQWFYFCVEDYTPGTTYRFNILNMEKSSSTFNEGQRPLMLLVEDAVSKTGVSGLPQWTRCGHDIFYYRNLYRRPARCTTTTTATAEADGIEMTKSHGSSERRLNHGQQASKKAKKVIKTKHSKNQDGEGTSFCYTLSFSVVFPEKKGRVFLANCFPYTYTNLIADIHQWEQQAKGGLGASALVAVQQLCTTPGGLPVPIITVTASTSGDGDAEGSREKNLCNSCGVAALTEIENRPVCIVTSRVHPGESNASWMLRGLLTFLLGDEEEAKTLRSSFVWKIIPMLNPDGVVLGNHRSSLGGADLNRDYADPNPWTNPVIYSLKRLTQHIISREQRHVALFADLHGHSRAKNFLIYGCTPRPGEPERKSAVRGTMAMPPSQLEASSSNSTLDARRQGSSTATSVTTAASSPVEKIVPFILSCLSPAFALPQCSFTVHKSKQNTGRVVMYRQFGIRMSYTLEATMMGGKDDEVYCRNTRIIPKKSLGGVVGVLQEEKANKVSKEEEKIKGAVEPWPLEVCYSTRQYENMGELLVRSLHLLRVDGEGLDAAMKETIERAWSLFFATTGNIDAMTVLSSPSMGGSYAFSTRKERRLDALKVKKEKTTNTATLSMEQRKELLRALLVRPKVSTTHPMALGSVFMGSESDDEEESEGSDDEDDDDVGDQVNASRLEDDDGESGGSDDDNEDDDDDDDDEDDDDDDDADDIEDEELPSSEVGGAYFLE
ncbi:putative zinc carboxypeptidase [Trypanosoma rangeli]|uniref:Putative zinc carboxypeptidase n=1 Tax=Trypanosoma rangeli TaxID=5698 RepID=A0A422NG91_TRYRA|nr:putative zinc carboxypeptidase [Trypanosoma rangeli]RNF04484.1 putative zinc carboxypeptidase [Trypanosoma rangeli]|eukprot:RNF04484.1 putative zinc carboxypeptidase [Trypanosoma rangeli]